MGVMKCSDSLVFIYIQGYNKTIYRVSHETWQLINSYECRLLYTVLDVKGFLQFISLEKSFV